MKQVKFLNALFLTIFCFILVGNVSAQEIKKSEVRSETKSKSVKPTVKIKKASDTKSIDEKVSPDTKSSDSKTLEDKKASDTKSSDTKPPEEKVVTDIKSSEPKKTDIVPEETKKPTTDMTDCVHVSANQMDLLEKACGIVNEAAASGGRVESKTQELLNKIQTIEKTNETDFCKLFEIAQNGSKLCKIEMDAIKKLVDIF
jgi:hypothetical protein